MEVDSIGVDAVAPTPNNSEVANPKGGSAKRRRLDGCFSFMEISIEPGMKSLKQLDSEKFRLEIKRWAKSVVTYARQVSDQLVMGSPRPR